MLDLEKRDPAQYRRLKAEKEAKMKA